MREQVESLKFGPVYADGHVLSGNTNKTWRSILDNNWRRYQLTTDLVP